MNILLTTRREKAERRNPIAILDLAAYLRRFGHTVDSYYLDQVKELGDSANPYDIVGLSVLQVVKEDVPLRDAIHLRTRFRSRVVVGGKWTQTITEEQGAVFKEHGIEVYDGPGERYFVDRDIDFESYPSWDKADFETLQDIRTDMMSTRGCPYHCHFCHNTEKKISFFSAKRTVDNIELLFGLGVSRISLCDDIFTLKPSHMEAVFKEIESRGIPIQNRIEFFTHINHISTESIRWIRKFQPFRVSVGVESGDDRMLKLMGKGFDSETAYTKLRMLNDQTNIPVGTLFLIGFPGETEESLQNTLRFVRRIRPFSGCWVSYYQPVRGTKGYEMALAHTRKVKSGRRNTSITYVDPGLSEKILFNYNYMMMDYADEHSLRRWIMYMLIRMLPTRILEKVRSLRQRKRLRAKMDPILNIA
jgi:radical SAM superfamily enzyme YgiQ (UPF0313 family)